MIPHIATIALTVTLISGCTTPVFHHMDPKRHVVVLDQMPISVLQTNTDTWEAWGGKNTSPDTQQFEWQIKAIEIVSGCPVQTSNLDAQDARRLYATVRCNTPEKTL